MFKPVAPKPIVKVPVYTLDDDMTVDQILSVIDDLVNDGSISCTSSENATIGIRSGAYGDDDSVVIRAVIIAHEKQYEKDMVKYLVKKSKYDAWWAENGKKITNVRKERELNEKESRIKRLEKEIERLKNG